MASAAAKSQTFTMGPKPLTKAEMRRWLDVQTFYENIAGDGLKDDVTKRACEHVKAVVLQHHKNVQAHFEKWDQINGMIRGTSQSVLFPDADLHVPKMYSAVERLAPRLVQALLGADDQWFKVIGRDRHDRQIAEKVVYWLRYLVDQCKINVRSEEWFRCALVHQFFALKSCWHVEYEKRPVRKYTKKRRPDGTWSYTASVKEEMVQTFEGMKLDLVEPMYFLYDLTKTDVKEMAYVGDQVWWDEQQIREMGRMGLWNNVDELLSDNQKKRPNPRGQIDMGIESYRQARQLSDSAYPGANGNLGIGDKQGEPRQFLITEVWRKWRPTDTGDYEEYVITTCGDIVLRIQKNPYDDKHRPYAVGRVAKEPFDFLNVGVLDHAARLNVELDDHRNLARMGHARSLCPIVVAPTDSDLPHSLFDTEPGQVFHADNPADIREIKSASVLGEIAGIQGLISADIDDSTGAPALYAGLDSSDTATQGVQNRLEANLRLRRLIFALGDGLVQTLEHGYALSQQFVSQPKKFRVLAQDADDVFEIAPDDLQDPVDIFLIGPSQFETYGMRATQIAAWMNMIREPLMLAGDSGLVDWAGLVRFSFQEMLGKRMDENLIRKPRSLDDLNHPRDENIWLEQGSQVRVHELDDHREHEAYHKWLEQRVDDPLVLKNIRRHLAEHAAMHNRQLAQRRAMQRDVPTPFMPAGSGLAMGARNKPQEGRYSQANTYQRPGDFGGPAPQQTPPGETPGPGMAHQVAAPDRDSATPQTQNR